MAMTAERVQTWHVYHCWPDEPDRPLPPGRQEYLAGWLDSAEGVAIDYAKHYLDTRDGSWIAFETEPHAPVFVVVEASDGVYRFHITKRVVYEARCEGRP